MELELKTPSGTFCIFDELERTFCERDLSHRDCDYCLPPAFIFLWVGIKEAHLVLFSCHVRLLSPLACRCSRVAGRGREWVLLSSPFITLHKARHKRSG